MGKEELLNMLLVFVLEPEKDEFSGDVCFD